MTKRYAVPAFSLVTFLPFIASPIVKPGPTVPVAVFAEPARPLPVAASAAAATAPSSKDRVHVILLIPLPPFGNELVDELGIENPILEGREGDSHRGDPPDFPQCVQPAIRRGADATFRAWGVGWRHMNVAVAAEPLLERSEELARIEPALAEARTGRGRFLVIEGPAGSARRRCSRRRGRQRQRAECACFARGEPSWSATSPTGWCVSLSSRRWSRHRSSSAPICYRARPASRPACSGFRAYPLRTVPLVGVDPSFAILHGLYWLCANLARVGPLCLVVDDAHWADAPSLRYLAFLLTRLKESDIALLVATRPLEAGTDSELLGAVTSDPTAEVIRLAPLTRAAVAQLLEDGLGEAPDPVDVDTCLRVTRGTPFLVRELVEALSERGSGIAAQTVGRSIHLRLGRLPEHAGRLARALAILEQSDLLQAARLAGLEEPEAADAADLLATAWILEPGRPLAFVHPLVREGIYSELSSAECAQGHRRAAELFAEQAGASARVAQHLLVSEPAADGWVVERLVEAADAAGKHGAPESVAVFLRRALAEPPPPGDRSALLLDLGMAEASAGLADWSEHLQQAVDAAPNAALAVEAAMVLAHALSRAQRYTEAVEVLDARHRRSIPVTPSSRCSSRLRPSYPR